MGVAPVVELSGEVKVCGDVGAGLVSVEADGGPPVGDGRPRGRRRRRDGVEEVSDDGLVGRVPVAVPDYVEVDGRRSKDRTHVVPEIDQVRRAFIVLGLVELSVWQVGKRKTRQTKA